VTLADVRERLAYHQPRIREDCVCGGAIVSPTFLPHDVVDAVRRHQIEPVHIAYDVAQGTPLAEWQVYGLPTDE
jgi:hypothetical protein